MTESGRVATQSECEWSCLICCEVALFKVVGSCDHPVCLTCSAKLRVLCEQKFCAVCREDLEHVSYRSLVTNI